MKMLLLDVYNNEVKMVEVNGLDDYYKYIGCSCIDIVRRKIGDLTVEIVCDDEGTFVEHPKVSAIDVVGRVFGGQSACCRWRGHRRKLNGAYRRRG